MPLGSTFRYSTNHAWWKLPTSCNKYLVVYNNQICEVLMEVSFIISVPCVSGLNAVAIQDPNDKSSIIKRPFVQWISDILSGFNRKALDGDTSFANIVWALYWVSSSFLQLLRPIYKQVAENQNAEIFSANTLLVILGTSLLTARVRDYPITYLLILSLDFWLAVEFLLEFFFIL